MAESISFRLGCCSGSLRAAKRIRDLEQQLSAANAARDQAEQAAVAGADALAAMTREREADFDDCDNCHTPMDGDSAITSDVCWDCWNALKRELAQAERERDDLRGRNTWLLERFEDCYNAAGCEGQARHPVELWNWIEARVASQAEAERSLATTQAALEEAVGVLREIEWAGSDDDMEAACCPHCRGLSIPHRDWGSKRVGHAPDCRLARVIAQGGGGGGE